MHNAETILHRAAFRKRPQVKLEWVIPPVVCGE